MSNINVFYSIPREVFQILCSFKMMKVNLRLRVAKRTLLEVFLKRNSFKMYLGNNTVSKFLLKEAPSPNC